MGRENTYTKVAAVHFVPQVRLQAAIADNSNVCFSPEEMTAWLLLFTLHLVKA